MPIRLIFFLGFAFLCALPFAAQAQTSVYGDISLTNYGYIGYSTSNDYIYKGDTGGIGGGATWLFPSKSRLKAGIDGRFSYSPGNRGGQDGSAALRIAFIPQENPLRPYFQIGGGLVHVPGSSYIVGTTNGYVASQQNNLTGGTLDLMFGLEVRTSARWSIRAVELGASAGSRVGVAHLGTGVIYTVGGHSHS